MLANAARDKAIDSIRINFAACITDTALKAEFETCYVEPGHNTDRVSAIFCAELNSCKPPETTPPQLKEVDIDFNKSMTYANDNKNIVIADFTLPGVGEFKSITVNYTKDQVNVFNLSTYAVNVSPASDRRTKQPMIQVKITAYDKTVSNVSGHKYSVAGTLKVVTPVR